MLPFKVFDPIELWSVVCQGWALGKQMRLFPQSFIFKLESIVHGLILNAKYTCIHVLHRSYIVHDTHKIYLLYKLTSCWRVKTYMYQHIVQLIHCLCTGPTGYYRQVDPLSHWGNTEKLLVDSKITSLKKLRCFFFFCSGVFFFKIMLMFVCVCVWACKDLHPGTILCF